MFDLCRVTAGSAINRAPSQGHVLQIETPNFVHTVYVGVPGFSWRKRTSSTNSINWLVFVIQTLLFCVHSQLGHKFLYIVSINFMFHVFNINLTLMFPVVT
jgi:hypothetical protein